MTQNERDGKRILLDSKGVPVKEFFYNNDQLEMEIEFYDTGVVRSIHKYKATKISKVLGFDRESRIMSHEIFKDGHFRIKGTYRQGFLVNIKTTNTLKDFLYNRMMHLNLYTDDAAKLKQSEGIKAPVLGLEHF